MARRGFWDSFLDLLFGESARPEADRPLLGAPMLANWLPYRSYDAKSGLFINTESMGFILELAPMMGADERSGEILHLRIGQLAGHHRDMPIDQPGLSRCRFQPCAGRLARRFAIRPIVDDAAKTLRGQCRDVGDIDLRGDAVENCGAIRHYRENLSVKTRLVPPMSAPWQANKASIGQHRARLCKQNAMAQRKLSA